MNKNKEFQIQISRNNYPHYKRLQIITKGFFLSTKSIETKEFKNGTLVKS